MKTKALNFSIQIYAYEYPDSANIGSNSTSILVLLIFESLLHVRFFKWG